jgi:hypothetical protein
MIECFSSKFWMDAKFLLFEYRNLWWGWQGAMRISILGSISECHRHQRIDRALAVLKIYKHSLDFLYFFGTFILELYLEFLSAFVMSIKFNTNGQVHPRSGTIQKASS